tara:strand:- start:205 stop:906 length:702 start_codon:yes stop_codon:yes gene_type:complete
MVKKHHKNILKNSMFFSLLIRDLTIYSRNKGNWINPLVFIFISITLFTIGIGPDVKLEINHSISIIWVVCVLSIMLCLNSLFVDDFEDGSLEQILLSPQPIYLAVLSKVFSFWTVSCLPAIVASPFLALIMNLNAFVIPYLIISLFFGTIILSFIGAISTSLTLSLNKGTVLSSIISLPFFIPVIIFGTEFTIYASQDWSIIPTLMMLLGLSLASLCLAPFAIISALRLSMEH